MSQVLAKFEAREYIHLYVSASSGTTSPAPLSKVELPRYGLSFTIKHGHLRSAEYRGYRLADKQQLGGLLPAAYIRYLVLERMDKDDVTLPQTKLLFPQGVVKSTLDIEGGSPLNMS
jgi:hypothetical protein